MAFRERGPPRRIVRRPALPAPPRRRFGGMGFPPPMRQERVVRSQIPSLSVRLSRKIESIEQKQRELDTQLNSLGNREKYFQKVALAKRKREGDENDDEFENKRRKIEDSSEKKDEKEVKSGRSVRSSARSRRISSSVLSDEKQKKRGKMFMRLLSFQLAKSKKEIKKMDKDNEVDDTMREEALAKDEIADVERQKEEGEAEKKKLSEMLEEHRELYHELNLQLEKCRKAKYLKTETKPQIMYKPVILTKEQKEIVMENEEKHNEMRQKIEGSVRDLLRDETK